MCVSWSTASVPHVLEMICDPVQLFLGLARELVVSRPVVCLLRETHQLGPSARDRRLRHITVACTRR